MKAVTKKLFSLMLVAMLLVSAVPFQALAAEGETAPEVTAPVETTEAAIDPQADIGESTPAMDAGVTPDDVEDELYLDGPIRVHFQLGRIIRTDGTEEELTRLLVSDKAGKLFGKVSAPAASNAMSTLAKVINNSNNYEFSHWEYQVDGTTYAPGQQITITEAMANAHEDATNDKEEDICVINFCAVFKETQKTITLNANGGRLSTTKHPVKVGEPYNYYGVLPTPTKTNSEFLGWYKADGTEVKADDIVTDLSGLTAKWSAEVFNVIYKAYTDLTCTDSTGWQNVTGYDAIRIRSDVALTVADGTFPSNADIDNLFLPEYMYDDGWRIDGWVIAKTGASVKPGTTKVNESMVENDGNIYIRPVYKKTITMYALDEGDTKKEITVSIGAKLPSLLNPGTRDGLAFMAWHAYDRESDTLGDELVKEADLSNVTKHPRYYPGYGDLGARWDEAVRVLLYVHVNGNVKDYVARMYYDVPKTGFDLTMIDLYSVYSQYGKYDDDGDKQYGWYNDTQWGNYAVGKPANTYEFVSETNLEKQEFREYHIMLIDNGNNTSTSAGNGYNNNASTADKSNPTTGDDIFVAVTIMAVSASALVLFFLNKKRLAK